MPDLEFPDDSEHRSGPNELLAEAYQRGYDTAREQLERRAFVLAEQGKDAYVRGNDGALRGLARSYDETAADPDGVAEMLDAFQLPANATPAQMLRGLSALIRSTLPEGFTEAEIADEVTPERDQFVARVRRLLAEQEGATP